MLLNNILGLLIWGIGNLDKNSSNLSNGQLISKRHFGVFNSPKKQRKIIWFEVPYIVVKSKIFVPFLEELKIPKRHFEINWP